MDRAAILGILWGILAALVQYGHLGLSVKGALRSKQTDPSIRIAWSLFGSLIRLVLISAMFLVAWRVGGIRLDACAVAFAIAHLALMLRLGFKVKTLLDPPNL